MLSVPLPTESELRLAEAERVGFGFANVPNVRKLVEENAEEVALKYRRMFVVARMGG